MTQTSIQSELSDAFREHVALGVSLHQLFLEGKPDSDEADAIRDRMDFTWLKMSDQEIEWYGGIAEDLNSLEIAFPNQLPEDEQVNELIGKLSSTELYHGVKDTERHFAVLDFLRNDLIKHPSMVRLIRGFQVNCYLDLQLEKVALLMSRECEKIDIEFRITTSKALWNLGCKIEAKEQAVKFFSSIQEFDADYVNNACHILFELGIEGNVEHLEEIIRKAIRDVREMRHMLPRRSAEEQLQLTELETSLASKLGSIIGPEATAKEFKVANAVSSMRRHFYPSYSMV